MATKTDHMLPPTQGQLRIVAALACELKSLIARLQLSKIPQLRAFDVYTNREHTIYALVSGVGKVASSAATAFLHAFAPHPCPGYFNLGIAGGAQAELGQVYQIGKITDVATQTNYYPSFISKPTIEVASLHTVDQAQSTYPDLGLVDMEASGFFATARRLVTQEHIEVCKIGSDNLQSPTHRITSSQVVQWVQAQWPYIETRCQRLLAYSTEQLTYQTLIEQALTQVKQQCRCSTYQQHQLRELLRRWQVLNSDQPLPLQACTNASQLIRRLTEQLETQAYDW
ncbi:MAG: hypothetical protein GKR77_01340 [Legionellales bacterium]|nr:hypothetical protein [Legionellales bacterium]